MRSRIRQMDWAGRTEDRGNAGETASSFFHPSGPSKFDYLIQRKSLILQLKSAREAGRTPFHPVNPGRLWQNSVIAPASKGKPDFKRIHAQTSSPYLSSGMPMT